MPCTQKNTKNETSNGILYSVNQESSLLYISCHRNQQYNFLYLSEDWISNSIFHFYIERNQFISNWQRPMAHTACRYRSCKHLFSGCNVRNWYYILKKNVLNCEWRIPSPNMSHIFKKPVTQCKSFKEHCQYSK